MRTSKEVKKRSRQKRHNEVNTLANNNIERYDVYNYCMLNAQWPIGVQTTIVCVCVFVCAVN